jgi:heptosyltransferase-3
MVDVQLIPLKALGLEVREKKVEIFWNETTRARVKNLLGAHRLEPGNFIHIHPVSRWFFKCIDDRTMAQVIDYCQERLGLPVVLTAAPVEKERKKIDAILAHCSSVPVNLAGKLSLKETAALNKAAGFFVGVDTAVMHISAANDTPVLAFFGPSTAFRWGPWDNALHHTGYDRLRGDQRMGKHQVVQMDWDCVPCNKDGCNGSKISDCLVQLGFQRIEPHLRRFGERHPLQKDEGTERTDESAKGKTS